MPERVKKCAFNDGKPCTDCDFSNHTVFRNLTFEQRETLCENVIQAQVVRKHNIFTQGNSPQYLYLLHSGTVKITQLGENGKEQIARMAKTGDLIGYRSVLSGENYRASATAMSDCCVCGVNRSFFVSLVENNGKIARDIISMLSRDLGQAERRMLSISYKSVRSRIAEAILMIAEAFGMEQNGCTIDVPIYRRDISDFAGITIETAIRNLNRMIDEGLLQMRNKHITILDFKRLGEEAHG